jgi:apolipoprotein N-acyltransferase
VLTGLITSGAAGETFNSAAICKTDGTLTEPYDKIHLLWFGEAVPLADQIPWIRRTFMRSGGLFPGEHGVVQEAGPVRAGVLNCFEDILSSAGREAMVGAPNLLVNVTNDAWFAGSAESEMHLRVAVMRAVEERRDLVRAVNLGPTTWVDAAGQVRGRYDSGLPGTLLAQPALLETPPTPFGRWGDAPTALAVTLVVACWLAAQRARRHRA